MVRTITFALCTASIMQSNKAFIFMFENYPVDYLFLKSIFKYNQSSPSMSFYIQIILLQI